MIYFSPIVLFLILISPAIGSFIALFADRYLRGEDIITKRSACRSCAAPLPMTALIPLISYLWQRGQCRNCGTAIPILLPLSEVSALGLTILAVMSTDTNAELILTCFVLWCLLALFICDAQWFRLPDVLTFLLLILALSLALISPNLHIFDALIGAIAGSLSFWLIRTGYYILRKREGLGLGDVKLMAGIGATVGWENIAFVTLLAALAGLIWMILQNKQQTAALQGKAALPFGCFLCFAAVIVWMFP